MIAQLIFNRRVLYREKQWWSRGANRYATSLRPLPTSLDLTHLKVGVSTSDIMGKRKKCDTVQKDRTLTSDAKHASKTTVKSKQTKVFVSKKLLTSSVTRGGAAGGSVNTSGGGGGGSSGDGGSGDGGSGGGGGGPTSDVYHVGNEDEDVPRRSTVSPGTSSGTNSKTDAEIRTKSVSDAADATGQEGQEEIDVEDVDAEVDESQSERTSQVPPTTNSRERWRQQHVNGAFSRLRAVVPCHPPDRKLSKCEILKLSIKYINLLTWLVDWQDKH